MDEKKTGKMMPQGLTCKNGKYRKKGVCEVAASLMKEVAVLTRRWVRESRSTGCSTMVLFLQRSHKNQITQ